MQRPAFLTQLGISDLHIALIAGGIGFVLLIWAINLWQERKLRRRIEQTFGSAARRDDVLLQTADSVEPASRTGIFSGGNARQEPYLGGTTDDAGATRTSSHAAHGPADNPHEPVPVLPTAQVIAPLAPAIESLVDCIVTMQPERPLSGELLAVIAQRMRHAGTKPVLFEGWSEDLQAWVRPQAGHIYSAIQVGILLANRSGPLNAIEFSDFVTGLEAIADELGVLPDFPNMTETLARAQELDAQCAQWDAQISLNIQMQDARYTLDMLQRAALQQGLVQRPDGKFLGLDETGFVLFTLTINPANPYLTLLLDVPRASPFSQPFARMTQAANQLAQALEGTIVDDAGRPVAVHALHDIEQQLQARYTEMALAGIEAGSPMALRLFN